MTTVIVDVDDEIKRIQLPVPPGLVPPRSARCLSADLTALQNFYVRLQAVRGLAGLGLRHRLVGVSHSRSASVLPRHKGIEDY